MDSKAVLLMLVLGVLLIAPYALAAEPAGGSVQGSAADQGEYPSSTAGTVSIESGNIYLANITGNMSTYHWAGVYGNATGKLVLGDSSKNVMYEWNAQASYVFFDNDTTVNWTNLDGATSDDIDDEFTFLSGASDSGANTFKSSEAITFYSIPNPTNNPAYAATYDNSKKPTWKTYALKDTTNGDIIFAAPVSSGTAYNGDPANYQVILPEDGSNGDTSAETYYIWIELY